MRVAPFLPPPSQVAISPVKPGEGEAGHGSLPSPHGVAAVGREEFAEHPPAFSSPSFLSPDSFDLGASAVFGERSSDLMVDSSQEQSPNGSGRLGAFGIRRFDIGNVSPEAAGGQASSPEQAKSAEHHPRPAPPSGPRPPVGSRPGASPRVAKIDPSTGAGPGVVPGFASAAAPSGVPSGGGAEVDPMEALTKPMFNFAIGDKAPSPKGKDKGRDRGKATKDKGR